MKTWKMESTRDLICLDFDFGSRSYEEEMEHLKKMLSSASDENKERIEAIIEETENNKYKYAKRSKDEIRELFYQNGVDVKYVKTKKDDEGNDIVVSEEVIHYKMLYRNSSKAKLGQVMFINEKLYKKAYNWLTMGLGNKMPYDNAKIVEMSAYAPLTTSTIVDMNGLLSSNANCNAILALSEFFKAFAVTMDKIATIIKFKPYRKQGTNELEFSATKVVK